jgi:predicted membrane channel-forming protein YqfA (hemolysin III family)
MGGIAALVAATAYITGFILFIFVLDPSVPLNLVERVAFVAEKQLTLYLAILFMYVFGGFILIVLVQALHERLKQGSPAMMQTAAVLGYIWAAILIAGGMIYIVGMGTVVELYPKEPEQAASTWLVIGVVFEGLG